ncbi:MAG: SDR family NAD(P)-dependent oxidoreductase [Acidimicrobiales bacterium]
MIGLEGKVAIITGGARGQGAAEAELFASHGAKVVVTDVRDELGEETAGRIGGEYLHHDVSSEDEWAAVVADVVARHGRLDVLVNNAGIFEPARLVNTSTELWNRTIAINQTGVFFGLRAVAQPMIDAGNGGSIVNISSVAGLEGGFGSMAYGATKWAVRGMTKIAAKELGRYGIRVNSIHPGMILTDMIAHMPMMADPERAVRNLPIKRPGEAIDIANMALFLVSDESSYCTGQEFTVDGGMHG